MTTVPGWRMPAGDVALSPAMPSRTGSHAFMALRQHGPYDNTQIELRAGAMLFVFPEAERELGRRARGLAAQRRRQLPRVQPALPGGRADARALQGYGVDTALTDLPAAARAFRDSIGAWNRAPREQEPDVALVLVPHYGAILTSTPYYEAKAAFANLGIPTQMVTTELLRDEKQFQWSVANIALAVFAKLGGIPWAVAAPDGDEDLIIGIGRADIGHDGDRRRHFGYAVTFVSNGIYRQTFSFTPSRR